MEIWLDRNVCWIIILLLFIGEINICDLRLYVGKLYIINGGI